MIDVLPSRAREIDQGYQIPVYVTTKRLRHRRSKKVPAAFTAYTKEPLSPCYIELCVGNFWRPDMSFETFVGLLDTFFLCEFTCINVRSEWQISYHDKHYCGPFKTAKCFPFFFAMGAWFWSEDIEHRQNKFYTKMGGHQVTSKNWDTLMNFQKNWKKEVFMN
jgi:hypothetical protein